MIAWRQLFRSSLILNVILIFYLYISWQSKISARKIRAYEKSQVKSIFEEISNEINEKELLSKNFSTFTDSGFKNDNHQKEAGLSESFVVIAPNKILDSPLNSLERKMYSNLKDCHTKTAVQKYKQKGDYWVLENYIPADVNFRCNESITYSTHADYTFLDNLETITSRWQGPVSIAVYSPGTDFRTTIDTILYLRSCMAEGIKKYVTFHLFFHTSHAPRKIPNSRKLLQRNITCNIDPPKWKNITTYRQEKELLYPVNVARNIAKSNSLTYFNFPLDIELYPSINIIPEFFKMLKKPDVSNTTNPRVYVFPIFEVDENQTVPQTKTELQSLILNKKAVPFHIYVCSKCHNQPKSKEWKSAKEGLDLSVFHIAKRNQRYKKWEPFYIGTDWEPIYDERLSWEGRKDKMTQMYIMCVNDYEFHILDNAFLVHRPGIKKIVNNMSINYITSKQNSFISRIISPEYKILFGIREGCVI